MKTVQPIRSVKKIEEIKRKLKEKSDRNRMLFVIGINTGLRISDLLELKVKDVKGMDFISLVEKKTRKTEKSKKNKTNKIRRIKVLRDFKKEIERYVKDKNNNDYLIMSRQGDNKPISRDMAYKILKESALECGVREIGTHSLRKTFGYHYYKETKDIVQLQKAFNHSDPSITLAYIGIDEDDADKGMEKFGGL